MMYVSNYIFKVNSYRHYYFDMEVGNEVGDLIWLLISITYFSIRLSSSGFQTALVMEKFVG